MADFGGKLTWTLFYFHRYWRMTPLMLATIGFCATLLPYIGDGPRWIEVNSQFYEACRVNWWMNALYIHNLLDASRMCLGHTWYLAVDMQFYIISPIFLRLLYRKPKWGVTLIVLTLLASIITTGVLTHVNDYPSAPYMTNKISKSAMDAYMTFMYVVPHTRIGPFLVGMLMGYYLHARRGAIVVNRRLMYLGWTLSTVMTLSVLYGLWPTHAYGILPSRTWAVLYGALSRTIWGVGMAWIVFASLAGYGGVIDKVMCWEGLVPLSRLSFTAYIIHPVLYVLFYGSREETLDGSPYLLICFGAGHVLLTYLASLVVSLLFESPLFALEKLFLPLRFLRKEVP